MPAMPAASSHPMKRSSRPSSENLGKVTSGGGAPPESTGDRGAPESTGITKQAANSDRGTAEGEPASVGREAWGDTPPEPLDRLAERAALLPARDPDAAGDADEAPSQRLSVRRPAWKYLLVRCVGQPRQRTVVERQQEDIARAGPGGVEGHRVPVGRGRRSEILMVVGRDPLLLPTARRHPIDLRSTAQIAVVVDQLPIRRYGRVLRALVAAGHLASRRGDSWVGVRTAGTRCFPRCGRRCRPGAVHRLRARGSGRRGRP